MAKGIILFLAVLVCASSQAATLSATQPLSTWHDASSGDKVQLVDTLVDQLRMSAGLKTMDGVPVNAITQCVDNIHVPDQLTFNGHRVPVTAGLAVVLCIKIHVPQLAAAKYTLPTH